MTIKKLIQRMEDTRYYFREIEDRNTKAALNNLADMLEGIIKLIDNQDEKISSFTDTIRRNPERGENYVDDCSE
jgi:hypothetical protein